MSPGSNASFTGMRFTPLFMESIHGVDGSAKSMQHLQALCTQGPTSIEHMQYHALGCRFPLFEDFSMASWPCVVFRKATCKLDASATVRVGIRT